MHFADVLPLRSGASIRAYDLFPMTHHIECVAVVETAGPDLA